MVGLVDSFAKTFCCYGGGEYEMVLLECFRMIHENCDNILSYQ